MTHFQSLILRPVKSQPVSECEGISCNHEACILKRFDSRCDLGPRIGLSRIELLVRAIELLRKEFTEQEIRVISKHGSKVVRPL